MKDFFNYPFFIYVVGTVASLCIMVLIDYFMGAKAEHLNAWAIINKLVGIDPKVPDGLAIRKLGLYGAAFLMILVNIIFGFVLITIFKYLFRLFQ